MFEMTFLDLNEQPISHLTQWDANQEIIISGEFTDNHIVHFCNKNSEYALCVQSTLLSDGKIQVAIPNILLCEPYPILIYVYSTTENVGKRTIISGKIPVRPRVEPENGYFEENHNVVYLAELQKQVIELNETITEAENERSENENSRIEAEKERTNTFNDAIKDCNDATSAANTAASDAYKAIEANDEAVENAIGKLDSAIQQAQNDIDLAIESANDSVDGALQDVSTAITNAETATDKANTAATTANEKIVIMQNLIESMDEFSVTFTEAETRENIVSGETLSVLFGKIQKWFTDIEASHEGDVTESDIAKIVS